MLRQKASPIKDVLASSVVILITLVPLGCGQIGSTVYRFTASPLSCEEARDYDEEGTTSWYGRAHHGRRTANGQVFDMNGLTAAHRSLPFGTKIRVTNQKNGRSVVLTVNDRGPFVMGRFLDVSYRAARELGFVREGLVSVRVKTVETC
ncbi:rare lipoprotein A [Nitrosococcus halophilus Nc 4]|uniref:Endolytic peptidoglycan transglycosylase RlpA n=2 Tax=Nitrosococcus halophilus TaxID=133539 RepID=D5BZM1_NITHN|nr:rare lipoprotein A [Nitrosococcus halophilus Nc 4]